MRILAHNGVDHATQVENVVHMSAPTIFWVVIVSAVIIAGMIGASLLIKKFVKAEETTEGNKES